jgi:hypothetical protein
METSNSNVRGRSHRTQEEINRLISEFDQSAGVSVKEFCEMEGISESTFYNWRKQCSDRGAGFVELSELSASEVLCNSGFAEVVLIRFREPIDATYIKTLLS